MIVKLSVDNRLNTGESEPGEGGVGHGGERRGPRQRAFSKPIRRVGGPCAREPDYKYSSRGSSHAVCGGRINEFRPIETAQLLAGDLFRCRDILILNF